MLLWQKPWLHQTRILIKAGVFDDTKDLNQARKFHSRERQMEPKRVAVSGYSDLTCQEPEQHFQPDKGITHSTWAVWPSRCTTPASQK